MKKFTSSYSLDGRTFVFSILSYKHEVDKWKKSHKGWSSSVREPLEIYTTPYISKNLL